MGYVRHASRLVHKASRSLSRFHWVARPTLGSTLLSCTTDKLLAVTCTHARTNRLKKNDNNNTNSNNNSNNDDNDDDDDDNNNSKNDSNKNVCQLMMS